MSGDCGNNGPLGMDTQTIYMLAILSIFAGGGFGSDSFWGGYGNAFRCSRFNNPRCGFNSGNPTNNTNLSNSIYSANTGSNYANSNSSNMDLTGILAGFSGILADGALAGLASEDSTDIND